MQSFGNLKFTRESNLIGYMSTLRVPHVNFRSEKGQFTGISLHVKAGSQYANRLSFVSYHTVLSSNCSQIIVH